MTKFWVLLTASILVQLSQPVAAQTTQRSAEDLFKLNWKLGPLSAEIAGRSTLSLGKTHVFLGADHTNKALELMGNLPSNEERYLVARTNLEWFAVFHFVNEGYVKDDEKIDADALLKKMIEQNKKSDEERRRRGLPALTLVGWSVPPHYDTATKRLEWGTKLKNDDGHYTVNYTSRLLGRSGYMVSILVTSAESFTQHVAEYKKLLTEFSYKPGEKYSEFKQGDRIAEYGLATLVAGGAAAAVVKSKGLWKLIGAAMIAGVVAIGAFLKKLFKKS